jgi:hypothetical protein
LLRPLKEAARRGVAKDAEKPVEIVQPLQLHHPLPKVHPDVNTTQQRSAGSTFEKDLTMKKV